MKRRLGFLIGAIMFLVFGYGLYRFPDAPLRPCGQDTGYCGKFGKAHTADEYVDFQRWQTSLFLIWPFGMLFLLLLRIDGRSR